MLNKSYDQFIIDFASFAALKHMIAYDYKKFDNQITQYLKILTKEKNNKLKYHIFEQEAVFLWLKNDKANAKEKFLKLANAVSGEINLKIKKRAKIMLKNL